MLILNHTIKYLRNFYFIFIKFCLYKRYILFLDPLNNYSKTGYLDTLFQNNFQITKIYGYVPGFFSNIWISAIEDFSEIFYTEAYEYELHRRRLLIADLLIFLSFNENNIQTVVFLTEFKHYNAPKVLIYQETKKTNKLRLKYLLSNQKIIFDFILYFSLEYSHISFFLIHEILLKGYLLTNNFKKVETINKLNYYKYSNFKIFKLYTLFTKYKFWSSCLLQLKKIKILFFINFLYLLKKKIKNS